MPPRLVRRQPLLQRLAAAANPWDFLLWLSEEFETRELDAPAVGRQVGLVANLLFLLARANLGTSSSADDDVFGDGGRGWLSYVIQLLVWAGCGLSAANAFSVLTRTRHYRLFEAQIETRPGTPSAHRVRVQSSPASGSPLRRLGDLLARAAHDTAESRAHPDGRRDVWELAVWDPRPAGLALLALFSPLHVLLYLLALPLDPLEPRPAAAVFRCLVLQAALSATLHLLQAQNDQRQRDSAIIQREVLHEYDTKFVQPRLHPVVRDVGTQASLLDDAADADGVDTGTPTTLIRRSFQTHPNANYVQHVDPDYGSAAATSRAATPRLHTPVSRPAARYSDSFTQPLHSSGGGGGGASARPRQSMPVGATPGTAAGPHRAAPLSSMAGTPLSTVGRTPGRGLTASATTNHFGGSMGVFSHVNSPLKKAISMNDLGHTAAGGVAPSPRNSRELAALEQREAAARMQKQQQQREASPAKAEDGAQPPSEARMSFRPQDLSSPPVPFNPFAKARPSSYKYERFPSRW